MALFTWKGKSYSVTVVLPLVALAAVLIAFAPWPLLR